MILCDTGFIVAALVRTDDHHARAVRQLQSNTASLVTTWPCLTEAIYLVTSKGGALATEGTASTSRNWVHHATHAATRRCAESVSAYASI